jgi:nitrite reductase/ring-hydroxylating ferredoxin subunit
MRAMAGTTPVFLLKRGDQIYALHATCTHAGGPLDEGTVDGETVTCPWHGSIFNVCTGAVLRGPASDPAMAFDVQIEDGMIQVRKRE